MKKLGWGLITLVAILLLAGAGVVYFLLLGQWHGTSYAAGKTNLVKVYTFESAVNQAEDAEAKESDESDNADDQKSDEKDNDDAKESGKSGNDNTEGGKTPEGESTDGMIEAGAVIRGSEVTSYLKSVNVGGVTYRQVRADLAENYLTETDEDDKDEDKDTEDKKSDSDAESESFFNLGTDPDPDLPVLYMPESSLADTRDETILEREAFVRTSATVYEKPDSPAIASFAPKGTHLDIIGHDELLDNGYINMYQVSFTGTNGKETEGYIYGKYTTDTQEAADAPYNEHGEYDKAKKDEFHFNLYGGKAKNLDFYPYERTKIEGNDFCEHARAMYINAYAAVHPEQYVKLIKESGCNAVVIDLKDGPLTYNSKVAKKLSPTSYKSAYFSEEELKKGVEAYRETGVYLIGRIVTFNDPNYAKDHPEDSIKYAGSTGWPSAFSRDVWEYNVRLAQEAVEEFGFNEIQFDYVRFPEATYEMSKSGKADFRNKYDESKAQAVQNFCFYAADQLRESGAYISVDVFGESAYSYVTAYGQYWNAISNIVDAISAMPYTDHFDGKAPWEDPYGSVYSWAKRAAKQQKRLQNPAAARTWITGYNTPHWAPTVNYNEKRLKQQIKALEDAGLDGGFIPWNVLSDIGKYRQYKGIWKE